MTMFREVENKGLPCHLFGYILDAEEATNYNDTLDIYFTALGDGIAEMEIPVASIHYNSYGIVHGGVLAGLIDTAMGMAMMTKNKLGVTASMSVNYLKSASKGDVLRAKAIVTRNGKAMLFCECKVYNQRDELLATGQGAFMIKCNDFVQYYAAKLRNNGVL